MTYPGWLAWCQFHDSKRFLCLSLEAKTKEEEEEEKVAWSASICLARCWCWGWNNWPASSERSEKRPTQKREREELTFNPFFFFQSPFLASSLFSSSSLSHHHHHHPFFRAQKRQTASHNFSSRGPYQKSRNDLSRSFFFHSSFSLLLLQGLDGWINRSVRLSVHPSVFPWFFLSQLMTPFPFTKKNVTWPENEK